MRDIHVYSIADNIISPLGISSEVHYEALLNGKSAIKRHAPTSYFAEPFYAALFEEERFAQLWEASGNEGNFTDFEKLAILSIQQAANQHNVVVNNKDTLFILATTKGNIEYCEIAQRLQVKPTMPNQACNSKSLLASYPTQLHLWHSAQLISRFFGNPNPPLVVSNACISGVVALITGSRLLRAGRYKQIVVCGADRISSFILNGFNALKALSPEPCRPYDEAHCGLNLGEGAATIILSTEKPAENAIELLQGATSNDANHISGPSRTGEGLYLALQRAMKTIVREELAFVNTHGTATVFNDNMEAIALTRAGLQHTPISSLKGYFGHTLGAAGVIESVMLMHALRQQLMPATYGFNTIGSPDPITVFSENQAVKGHYALKCASGFGGCNAALGFKIRKEG
jgi:3-oxoacyl-[acyl-carrier-protein] synthase-1